MYKKIKFVVICSLVVLSGGVNSFATTAKPGTSAKVLSEGGVVGGSGGGGTVTPDLFTGTMSYSIPVEVPAGRHGMQPSLVLTYSSNNGNGFLGIGWDLDTGAIERSARKGIDYVSGDDYILRTSGSAIDLVKVNSEYRAKVEGGFTRVKKLTAADGKSYWEATDRSGKKYFFGQTTASRQEHPLDGSKIFKWCLDRVEDTNGNYMTVSYTENQGQIYPDRIDYTGNGSLLPTNYVKFYWESRSDAAPLFATNFKVVTAYRLKTVYVVGNGSPFTAYKLNSQYSTSTGRSLLSSVQQFGDDVILDASGTVTGGSALPAQTFSYSSGGANFMQGSYKRMNSGSDGVGHWTMDVNGDGNADLVQGWNHNGVLNLIAYLSNGDEFNNGTSQDMNAGTDAIAFWPMDVNGDGKTDLVQGWNDSNYLNLVTYISNGAGFNNGIYKRMNAGSGAISFWAMDVNGDGKTDLVQGWDHNGVLNLITYISNGAGFNNGTSQDMNAGGTGAVGFWPMDVNGDGKTDLVQGWNDSGYLNLVTYISNGAGFINGIYKRMNAGYSAIGFWAMDVNGDGKTDLVQGWSNPNNNNYLNLITYISNGIGFINGTFQDMNAGGTGAIGFWPMDVNGDGKADLVQGWSNPSNNNYLNLITYISNGIGFINGTYQDMNAGTDAIGFWPMDVNGDGKTDLVEGWNDNNYLNLITYHANGYFPDMLASITNSFGGSTSITYKRSTQYSNTQLPFPVRAVRTVTTDDGIASGMTTTYDYSGGFYHIGERDFRGFNYVKVSNEQVITETWFHQGNDTSVDVNSPYVSGGYMKGKPYRVEVSDASGSGTTYLVTTTSYGADADGAAPYFNPPAETEIWTDEGLGNSRHTKTIFIYDDTYGYLTRQDQYGDVADPSDDRTVTTSYSPNTTSWILDKPTNESIYSGVTGTTLIKVSQTDYYYDQTSDCNTASTNQTPTKGHVTRIVRWLNGGVSPEVWMAYDNYGNLTCTRDAKGKLASTLSYDATYTFVKDATNFLGHVATTQHYGVDQVPADNGLYGQIKSVTDPNLAETTYKYDPFGRKKIVTTADLQTTTWSYNNFGIVGSQHVRVDAPGGLWNETYFDGLGRTTKTRKIGSDSKVVVTKTEYNASGTAAKIYVPYFESDGAGPYTTFTYDPMGRALTTTSPDGTGEKVCYDVGVVVVLDANGHRKRETRNALGKLVKVEEYQTEYELCTTETGSVYARTNYEYDPLGNLQRVRDNYENQTVMGYDSLGRKTSMSDPDMGAWSYTYDENGNLSTQTDAKNQTITFAYDELNRVKTKHYPDGSEVRYNYDDAAVPYVKGRLTKMEDSSGSSRYFYDNMGRAIKSEKIVSGATYTTETAYDTSGRVSRITYPDSDIVSYSYDTGGVLSLVSGATGTYASYSGYNALGQPQTVTYGNNVVTSYEYNSNNNRLWKIKAGSNGALMNLTYGYDYAGNVTSIDDGNGADRSQTFIYDDLNRLYQAQSNAYGALFYSYDEIGNILNKEGISYTYGAKPHAVTATSDGKTYTYDPNGNMISDGTRTISYDYDNRPSSVEAGSTTSFVYDGTGARVKKTTGVNAITYIGKLYECSAGVCAKYIFAGDTRIANKTGADVLYYHSDHLGSNRLVTNNTGTKVEEIHYYPFGATQSDTGSLSVNHKYTSQEYDAETGLYYYNARYYNPILGRFISPDTIVPNPANPQDLNRYSYVGNNPLNYTDPSGHSLKRWVERVIDKVLDKIDNPYVAFAIQTVGQFYAGPAAYLLGTYELTRSEKGKAILAAEIVIVTAVATYGCVECSTATVGALDGALSGEIAGGISAAKSDGDILKGVIFGGVVGGTVGYFSSLGPNPFSDYPISKYALRGYANGLANGYAGGKGDRKSMREGAKRGMITGAALGYVADPNTAVGGWISDNAPAISIFLQGEDGLSGPIVSGVTNGLFAERASNANETALKHILYPSRKANGITKSQNDQFDALTVNESWY
jgi:RHS repeat-associated protein